MPARLVQVTLRNRSRFPVRWLTDGHEYGTWQDPWLPSNVTDLKPGEDATWRSESDTFMQGTKAWADLLVDIPFANNVGIRTETIHLWWSRPYYGDFRAGCEQTRQNVNLPFQTFPTKVGVGNMGSQENLISEALTTGIVAGTPFIGGPFFPLIFRTAADHVWVEFELRNTGDSAAQPLRVQAQGFIYALMDNGDLLWYRHDGRRDGSFTWAFNEGKKVGHGWNPKQIFSGGDGVIYALMENGDLLWYRHDGRFDGSFTWAFNEGKKVGHGWNPKQIFSGGDGVIYALMDNGDLLWYRHDGRFDGSFTWAFNEGKKVGHGWNPKQIFSGGDGVIYALMENGDLLWYRHDGRGDGSFTWAFNEGKKVGHGWNPRHVFSGDDGVIYALMENGDLLWYRHDGRGDGSFTWAFNEGKKVGNGWNPRHVFSGS
jgi:hypothetical protein